MVHHDQRAEHARPQFVSGTAVSGPGGHRIHFDDGGLQPAPAGAWFSPRRGGTILYRTRLGRARVTSTTAATCIGPINCCSIWSARGSVASSRRYVSAHINHEPRRLKRPSTRRIPLPAISPTTSAPG